MNLCSSVRMRCSFATSRNTSELRKLLRVLRIALIGRQFEHRSQGGNYRGIMASAKWDWMKNGARYP